MLGAVRHEDCNIEQNSWYITNKYVSLYPSYVIFAFHFAIIQRYSIMMMPDVMLQKQWNKGRGKYLPLFRALGITFKPKILADTEEY